MRAMVAAIVRTASDWIDRIVQVMTAVLASAFTLLVFVSVLTRYVFNVAIVWSVEVSKLLFVWSAFLAATLAFKRHSHIRFEFLNRALGRRGRLVTDILLYVACLLFFFVVFRQSIIFTRIVWPTTLPVIALSQGWLYVPVIVTSVVFFVHSVALLIDAASGLPSGEDTR